MSRIQTWPALDRSAVGFPFTCSCSLARRHSSRQRTRCRPGNKEKKAVAMHVRTNQKAEFTYHATTADAANAPTGTVCPSTRRPGTWFFFELHVGRLRSSGLCAGGRRGVRLPGASPHGKGGLARRGNLCSAIPAPARPAVQSATPIVRRARSARAGRGRWTRRLAPAYG